MLEISPYSVSAYIICVAPQLLICIWFFLSELLKVIRETENDDLTGVMQKLISTYGDQQQVTSIAVDIAKDLVIQPFTLLFCTSFS